MAVVKEEEEGERMRRMGLKQQEPIQIKKREKKEVEEVGRRWERAEKKQQSSKSRR